MNMVKALGYISAPVVVSGDEHWSGFRIDRLNGLVEREEAA
jgi:glutaredoxin-like protein NrdH